jgi:hypothetical protein
MSSISSVGKLGYVYNEAADTWFPLAGSVDTTQPFNWTGAHSFANNVSIAAPIISRLGINNFENPTQRDASIPNPQNGSISFVRNNLSGGAINQLQYYSNGSWRPYGDNAGLLDKTASFVLSSSDAGRTIDINISTNNTVTIPTNAQDAIPVGTQFAFIQSGTGQTSFAPANAQTVIIQSKLGNRKISSRYAQAVLIKKAENTWYLFGDLTA